MAGEDVITNLIAKDQMSGALRKIATEAEKLADALEETGDTATETGKKTEKAGEQGARGIKQMGDAAEDTRIDMQALSAGLAVVGAGLAYAGNKAMEQERQIIGLQFAYGSAADEMIRFAEEMDDLTMFSDDDIRAGERFFATLYNNYDMSIDQIQEMIRLTADLASISGVSFEDASNRITAAIRGEAEAAEWLGLTMNQASIDVDNLTLSMTNAEAAQFRYNALLDQAAVYRGAASEFAASDAGRIAEWRDMVDDAAAAAGNFLGPAASMAAGLGSLGFGITGLTGGLQLLRTLPVAAATALRTKLVPALTATNLAMGAVGIAITAGAVLAYKLWDAYTEGARVTDNLAAAYENLASVQNELLLDGNMQAAEYVNNLNVLMSTLEDVANQRSGDLPTYFPDLMGMYQEQLDTGFADYRDFITDLQGQMAISEEESVRLADAQGRLGAAFRDNRIDGEALNNELAEMFDRYLRDASYTTDMLIDDIEALSLNTAAFRNEVEQTTETATGLRAAMRLLNEEANSWLGTILSLNEISDDDSFMTRLLKTLGTSEGDRAAIGAFLQDVEDLYTNLDDMPGPDATHAEWVAWVNEAEQGTLAWRLRIAEANQAMAEQGVVQEESNRNRRRTVDLIREEAIETQLLGMDIRDLAVSTNDAAEAQAELQAGAAGVGAAFREQAIELAAAKAEYDEMVADNLRALLDVAGFGGIDQVSTEMRLASLEASAYAEALDTVYRVTVSNTDAIASQSDAIHSWAEDLIGVQGEYSKLDDLVKAGRISGESGVFTGDSEYAQAQRAFNDIARENAEIQEHVLTIQAKQAPIIRDQMEAYENYLQSVADMPAEQQLIALGWMDTTASMRAMEFQTLAVAAATGQLGTNGEEVFTSMITGAAQADPVLKALLIDMGLISEGANGEITVNLSGAEGARSEIGQLTDAIVFLIDLLDDDEINGSFTIDAEDRATDIVRTAWQNLDDVDGESATMELHLNDFATAGISAAQAALNALDGDVATTTIRTIYENRGIGRSQAIGGVVQSYARGGVPTELAEAGPEILHFANGGTAYIGQRGIYAVEPGTYVQPNNAISNSYGGDTFNQPIELHVHGNVYGIDDLASSLETALLQRRNGFGGAM